MNKVEELIEMFCPDGVIMKEIGAVAKILNGYAFKSGKYVESGIRVIRISDVQKGEISDNDLKFYPIEKTDEINNYLLKENDLVMSLTGNVGRVAMLSEEQLPAGLNQRVACVRTRNNEILTRFLFHFFDQNDFEKDAMTNATGGGQKNMSTTWLSKYRIPIPPLPVQQEIVTILDNFTKLAVNLKAELQARTRQYEYYRNELFNFEGKDLEWKTLGDVAKILRGTALTEKDSTSNEFPVIANAPNPVYSHGKYNRTGETIVIARSGAYAGLVSYWNMTFFLTDAFSIHPNNKLFNTKFVYYLLKRNQDKIHQMKKGSGVPHVRANDFNSYSIPMPPLHEQERIVGILDKFEALVNDISIGLPAEIKARRKQYEYYRGKLLDFKSISNG